MITQTILAIALANVLGASALALLAALPALPQAEPDTTGLARDSRKRQGQASQR